MPDYQTVINISGLRKNYRAVEAVKGIDLQVKRGEMFGLVGPDGAGKTTTIKMLCGILPGDSGEIEILGYRLPADKKRIKNEIGYLSQRFSLYGDLSVDENIEFFAEIHGVSDYKERRDQLLEFTRLKPFRTRLADKLSGGMKQKLALSCTLVYQPKVIFLDEPTTGVDPVSRRDFWRILSQLMQDGITIFLSTPYMDEAERCTRIAMMNEGRILRTGTPAEIRNELRCDIIEVLTPDVRKILANIDKIEGAFESQMFGDRINILTEKKEATRESLNRFAEDNDISITNIRIVAPRVENVFISLLKSDKS